MPAERRPKRHSIGFWLYLTSTVTFACALAALIASTWGPPTWTQVAVFWVLNGLMLLDRIEVPVEKLSVLKKQKPRGIVLSPGFVVLLTAAFATKPSTAMAVAVLPPISSLVWREDRVPWKISFNAAQESIYVGVASVVFVGLRALGPDVLVSFAAAGVAAITAFTLNTAIVAGVVALDRGVTLNEIFRRMTWPIPHSIAFGLIALMIATLYAEFGVAAAAFLFLPLVALRFARKAKVDLDDARQRTITEFVRAVETKDPYTFRHSERVATIAVELHRELGRKAGYLELRWSGGVLHDIGKVAVPAEILTKSAALTPEEFETIKLHPGLGADVVDEIDSLRDLVPEIRHHHERMDGRGYPQGLRGEAIPYEARVLAVADAFEALTSDRPYRRGLTTEEALGELERTAGVHHDPQVVAALRRVIAGGVSFERPEGRKIGEVSRPEDRTAVGQ